MSFVKLDSIGALIEFVRKKCANRHLPSARRIDLLINRFKITSGRRSLLGYTGIVWMQWRCGCRGWWHEMDQHVWFVYILYTLCMVTTHNGARYKYSVLVAIIRAPSACSTIRILAILLRSNFRSAPNEFSHDEAIPHVTFALSCSDSVC